MDSSWKNLQIRMEAAWNMRTTPKTKRPKTGDIISSAHSLDWNKKKVRQLQQQWNDEVTKLVTDRNKAISDVMVDILTLIRMDIKSASSVLISHDAAKMLWEKAYKYLARPDFYRLNISLENDCNGTSSDAYLQLTFSLKHIGFSGGYNFASLFSAEYRKDTGWFVVSGEGEVLMGAKK